MAIVSYDKLALLLPFNEAAGAISFIDYSPTEYSVDTNSGVVTSSSPGFVAGEWGAADYLRLAQGDKRFKFGSGDWTIRFKYRRSGTNQDFARILQTRDGDIYAGIGVYFGAGADSSKMYLTCSLNGSSAAFTSTMIQNCALNTEYDFEFVRSGTTIKAFVGGTEVYTTSLSGALYYSATDYFVIGGQSTPARSIVGYLRDFEVYTGAALHTAGFTAPAGGSRVLTISGNVKNDTGANTDRIIRAYPRNYTSRGFEVTSSGTTGNYSMQVPDVAGGLLVVSLDDASGTTYKDLVHSQVQPG